MLSGHLGEGAQGHRQAEAEDDERADRGEQPDQAAVEVDAAEDAAWR